ncbi:hypothetical protein B0H13DRAFT_1896060 [Mycena leptocephala]|nr:hypothetical protein B0H13DRAFT_1896060 [Mycena leptocephala]
MTWAEAERVCKHSPPTRHNEGKSGPGPKASKVWKKFLQSSKAYSKAFLSLKPVKALGLRANTVEISSDPRSGELGRGGRKGDLHLRELYGKGIPAKTKREGSERSVHHGGPGLPQRPRKRPPHAPKERGEPTRQACRAAAQLGHHLRARMEHRPHVTRAHMAISCATMDGARAQGGRVECGKQGEGEPEREARYMRRRVGVLERRGLGN